MNNKTAMRKMKIVNEKNENEVLIALSLFYRY